MNVKSKSDKGFLDFLRSGGGSLKIWVILLLGAALILIGSLGGTDKKSAPDTETRVAEMCALAEGVGRCEVMLTYGSDGEVESALVLCDGGDLPSVRARVTDMVSSLFGIGTNRIMVQKISD